MADQTNPTSGQTIDLRDQGKTGTPVSGAAAGQTATAGNQGLFDKFDIPEAVRQQYPELIPMILQTESMNDDERQYWFQILPIMTEEQVGKLREILNNEKQQLSKLDNEYENELKKINDKHVSEWKEFEAKEKRKKIQAAESQTKKTESATEEDLLKKLQNL
ncbi:MAG: hypothetical protein AAB606_00530 [Patescibacteria group bacterium]